MKANDNEQSEWEDFARTVMETREARNTEVNTLLIYLRKIEAALADARADLMRIAEYNHGNITERRAWEAAHRIDHAFAEAKTTRQRSRSES